MTSQINPRYETFFQIIEQIRTSAPAKHQKLYNPSPTLPEKVTDARGLAFIHLFLMVKFGLLNFDERHELITEGSQDGGVDAYCIDHQHKKIYLIQSKFHSTSSKFEGSFNSADEIVKMEIDRIMDGQKTDSNGIKFNDKIRKFQQVLNKTTNDIYDPVVIFLANIRLSDAKLKKLIGNFKNEVFDYNKTYQELVFPMCEGTYQSPVKVKMEVSLKNKKSWVLDQDIKTKFGRCGVTIIFVPAKEVGKFMAHYKNAILHYNPRNYLSLKGNPVNKGIEKSITDLTTNEFSILNNGITLLAEQCEYTGGTGKQNVGLFTITYPQIINGGQTAFTLSEIYEGKYLSDSKVFDGKEVMFKVISLGKKDLDTRKEFIEQISNATNKQTKVDEADRRSNYPVFIEMQKLIYQNYGYMFERKVGEFYNGLNNGYLDKKFIVDRTGLVKSFLAYRGDPASCRSVSESALFREDQIKKLFPNSNVYINALFAYKVYRHTFEFERSNLKKNGKSRKYGSGLRLGKYAIVAAVGVINRVNFTGKEDLDGIAIKHVQAVLKHWREFEKYAKSRPENAVYFSEDSKFEGYYKGTTLNDDIAKFFAGK